MSSRVVSFVHVEQVQRIFTVSRSSCRYEVREVPLLYRKKGKLSWPFTDESVVDDRDLQIMYHLGSTTSNSNRNAIDIMATSVKDLP